VDTIIKVAAHYSLPVLDLYRTAGICPRIPEQLTRFMPDGLHPNDAGAYRIAERLTSFLNTL
jgi:lysophospholipase L1-like esterase